MKQLSIDLETYSDIDLRSTGVYRYVDSPNFRILLFGYAIDDEPVKVIDLASGEQVPEAIRKAVYDPAVEKTAYNANFEMTCLSKFFSRPVKVEQWRCSAVLALYCGLPQYLDGVAKALRFPEDKQKMAVGKRLIEYFCKPCKPTKSNGGRTRNLPQHDPERWNTFKVYCGQDVEVEREILRKLDNYRPPEAEQRLWNIDQAINNRGVMIDRQLVGNAIKCDEILKAKYVAALEMLTRLDNPCSSFQFTDWLSRQLQDRDINSCAKDVLRELIAAGDVPDKIKEACRLKLLVSKSSIKKYTAMRDSVCSDGRCHGMLRFYGASRSGRWSGKIVQMQNLPRNNLEDLDDARRLLKAGDYDALEFLYDSVPDVLSQLIRTAFIARPGTRFVVADFSAIEARVIAWLADEKWRQDTFAAGGDIYCASASQMFHVPVVKHGINGELRQKGKVAELALGYGGGPGALIKMGALEQGLKEDELPGIVKKWRESSPHIIEFWQDLDRLAKETVKNKGCRDYKHGIRFRYDACKLMVRLPSGRELMYLRPKIEPNKYGTGLSITYEGMGQAAGRSTGWARLETYGGKLTENIVQAVARDCLAEAMLRVPYDIVFHVHDELICEIPEGRASVKELVDIMRQNVPWNNGLIMNADGYECKYYKKD